MWEKELAKEIDYALRKMTTLHGHCLMATEQTAESIAKAIVKYIDTSRPVLKRDMLD
jgi:hypothetical protein